MLKALRKIVFQTIFPKILERTELAFKYSQQGLLRCVIIEKVNFKGQDFTLLYTSGTKTIVIEDMTPNIVNNNNLVHYQFVRMNNLKDFIKKEDSKENSNVMVFDFLANLKTGVFVTSRLGTNDNKNGFNVLQEQLSKINSVKHYSRKLGDQDLPIAKKPDYYHIKNPKTKKVYENFMIVWENLNSQKIK